MTQRICVEKWFHRRTNLSRSTDHVDLSLDASIVVVTRSDIGDNFTIMMVGDEDTSIVCSKCFGLSGVGIAELFKLCSKLEIECRSDTISSFIQLLFSNVE